MSAQPTEVIQEFLASMTADKFEAAARRLFAEGATYISLNFDNPELKQILPWTGTSQGFQAFIDAFYGISKWWTTEDFAVTALFGKGENVAVVGRFTYRSNSLSKAVTSPFSIHAMVRNGKIMYFSSWKILSRPLALSARRGLGPSKSLQTGQSSRCKIPRRVRQT